MLNHLKADLKILKRSSQLLTKHSTATDRLQTKRSSTILTAFISNGLEESNTPFLLQIPLHIVYPLIETLYLHFLLNSHITLLLVFLFKLHLIKNINPRIFCYYHTPLLCINFCSDTRFDESSH